MSWVFARSFDEQMDVQRIIESSRWLTLESSSRWSKTETGATTYGLCYVKRIPSNGVRMYER